MPPSPLLLTLEHRLWDGFALPIRSLLLIADLANPIRGKDEEAFLSLIGGENSISAASDQEFTGMTGT